MSNVAPLRPTPDRFSHRFERIEVAPVTPLIGAEISGIDLTRPLVAATRGELETALHHWRVLFFRDQKLSNDQLKTFGRGFGPLTPAHPISEGLDDHPEIWERSIADYRVRRTENDTRPASGRPPIDYKGWHIDITFVANPNRYSILYGAEIPAYGGDTLFTNLVEAYDNLSPRIKALVDGLQAVHQTSSYDTGDRKPRRDGRGTGPFVSLHPLVRVHPETGEKVLFLNPGVVTHIAGLRERESAHLLELLFGEVTRPEYTVRFRWRPHSLVVWDNQAIAHAGPIDYAHFELPRVVRRITVAGGLPKGPDGFVSRPLEGELFGTIE